MVSAMVSAFLQGAADFVAGMAPLLIMYQAYEHGGLPYSLQCGDGKYWPERIGLDTEQITSNIELPTSLDDIQATGRRLQTATAPVCQNLTLDQDTPEERWSRTPKCLMTPLQDDPVGFSITKLNEDDEWVTVEATSVVTFLLLLFGAVCLAVGGMLLGYRTLNRMSYELITSASPSDGFCVVVASTLVWAFFLVAGIPLSLTHLTVRLGPPHSLFH